MSSNSWRQSAQIALLLWAGVVATSFFTLAPALVGALMDQLRLSVTEVGLISSAQLGGSALGNLLVLVYGRRLPVRTALIVAGAATGVLDWMSAFSLDGLTIGLCRLLAGLAGGMTFAVVNAVAARLPRPGVIFASVSIGQMLFGIVGFIVLPSLLGAYGLAGAFRMLSGCSCVCVLAAVFFAPKEPVQTHGLRRALSVTPAGTLLLLALLATYLASTAIWTYLERIGVASGLGGEVISAGLSVGMAFGVLGAVCAAWLLRRRDNLDYALLGSAILVAVSNGLLLSAPLPSAWFVGVCGFNTALALVTPVYLARLAFEECGDARILVAMLAIYLGLIGGPILGAGLVAGGGYAVLITACTVLFAGAALLVLLATRMRRFRVRPGEVDDRVILAMSAEALRTR